MGRQVRVIAKLACGRLSGRERTVVTTGPPVEVRKCRLRRVSSTAVSETNLHPRDRWFEDWSVGDVYISETPYVMEQARMISFAEEFDPQDFHTDPELATASNFGGLIASGWHTGSALMRQITEFVGESSMGAAGVDELRWNLPVRPGDVLRLTGTVVETRPSATKPDRGIVRIFHELKNQRDEVAMSLISIMFIKTRDQNGRPGGSR
jgi:acyl dehydratase